jgi:MtN3 and saliva related transmembrane protein
VPASVDPSNVPPSTVWAVKSNTSGTAAAERSGDASSGMVGAGTAGEADGADSVVAGADSGIGCVPPQAVSARAASMTMHPAETRQRMAVVLPAGTNRVADNLRPRGGAGPLRGHYTRRGALAAAMPRSDWIASVAMTRALAVLAATYGVLMGVSPILQIRRMVVRKSSSDVSVSYFGILTGGFVLWLLYGLAIGNAPLIITNVVAVTAGLATIAVARLYRHRDPQQA